MSNRPKGIMDNPPMGRFLFPLLVAVLAWLALALGVWVGQAHGTTIVGDHGFQEWVDAIKRVPTPDGEVTVTVRDCGALGCTDLTGIELSPLAAPVGRKVFLHELGHVFDGREMTDADRGQFIALTGRPLVGWWDAPRFSYGRMAGEWFADVYAICAGARRISAGWDYTVGDVLLAGWRVQRGCGLIRVVAA